MTGPGPTGPEEPPRGAEAVEAAQALEAALREAGFGTEELPMRKPRVTSRTRRIDLGEVSIPVAAQLAIRLGAPRVEAEAEYDEGSDLSFWAYGQEVGRLLSAAFRRATGGALVDLYVHPDCMRCNSPAGITLGTLDVPTALRLAKALRPRS